MGSENHPQKPAPPAPEHLGEMLTVARPGAWIALAALAAVLLTALAWSIWGRVPTKVSGMGILVYPQGVLEVVSQGRGLLGRLLVEEGDAVRAGQVVALVERPDLKEKIATAKMQVASLQQQLARLQAIYARYHSTQDQCLAAQRADLLEMVKDQKRRQQWLQERIRQQRRLLRQGLITEQDLIKTREEMQNAREDMIRTQAQLKKVGDQRLKLKKDQEQSLFQVRLALTKAQNNLEFRRTEYQQAHKVTSAYAGVVVQINLKEGDEVAAGQVVLNLQKPGVSMQALAYLPAQHGKRVQPGMRAEVVPTTVREDQYGFLVSRVLAVSTYPVTSQAMRSTLGDPDLVKLMLKQGPVIKVRLQLQSDPSTPTGMKWSSLRGPPFKVTVGTLVNARVVLQENAPITLVLPLLKKWLGV